MSLDKNDPRLPILMWLEGMDFTGRPSDLQSEEAKQSRRYVWEYRVDVDRGPVCAIVVTKQDQYDDVDDIWKIRFLVRDAGEIEGLTAKAIRYYEELRCAWPRAK